jgi:enoyl-CoA hydratase/carnithine racemase
MDPLDKALDGAEGATALVLTGAGDKAFVSGGDLKELGALRTNRKPRRWPSGCAPSAERIGLIDRVLPRASFHDDWRSIARLLASRAAGEIKTVIRGATIAEAVSAFARLWRSDEHWSAADKVMKRGK